MKLVRLAFWLGVVIYNLPSPASQSAAPESRESQGLAAKAPGQSCPQRLVFAGGRLVSRTSVVREVFSTASRFDEQIRP